MKLLVSGKVHEVDIFKNVAGFWSAFRMSKHGFISVGAERTETKAKLRLTKSIKRFAR